MWKSWELPCWYFYVCSNYSLVNLVIICSCQVTLELFLLFIFFGPHFAVYFWCELKTANRFFSFSIWNNANFLSFNQLFAHLMALFPFGFVGEGRLWHIEFFKTFEIEYPKFYQYQKNCQRTDISFHVSHEKLGKASPVMATPKLSSRWLPLAPYLGFPHMSFTDTAYHLLCYLRNKFAEAVLRGDITKMEEFTLHNGLQVRDNVCFTYKGWRYRKNAWPFAFATNVPRFLGSIRFTIPPFLVIGCACTSAALHWAQRTPTANNTGYLALIKSSKDRHKADSVQTSCVMKRFTSSVVFLGAIGWGLTYSGVYRLSHLSHQWRFSLLAAPKQSKYISLVYLCFFIVVHHMQLWCVPP